MMGRGVCCKFVMMIVILAGRAERLTIDMSYKHGLNNRSATVLHFGDTFKGKSNFKISALFQDS